MKKILLTLLLIALCVVYLIPLCILIIIGIICLLFGIHNDITSTKFIILFITPLTFIEDKLKSTK